MTFKKKVLALALAVSSVPAFAGYVGGIEVGDGGSPHFEAAEVYEQFVSKYTTNPGATTLGVGAVKSIAAGAQIAGYGRVNSINSNLNFCVGGPGTCELTFRFFGYTVKTGATINKLDFSGGQIDFYVATGADIDFNPNGATEAQLLARSTNGTLWMSVAGSDFLDIISGRTGTLQADGKNFGTGTDSGTGVGQLNIIGGMADVMAALDSNSVDNHKNCTLGVNCSDFDLTTSFSVVGAAGKPLPLAGVASLAGRVLPEPATLGLMGLGLLGLGAAGRRRRNK